MSKVSQIKSVVKDDLWKAYDFLFPGGKLAKLIKVTNIYKKNLPVREMLDKLKYTECTPVINIVGGMEKGRGKFYAGIARAAFNTDAVIVDNGLASGLEKFTLRRGVKLIGIAPEGEIKFPKINPSQVDPMELANGHTHLFLVSNYSLIPDNPEKDLHWGGEVQFKIDACLRIAEGAKPKKNFRCKIVSILMGDSTFDIVEEIKLCVEN